MSSLAKFIERERIPYKQKFVIHTVRARLGKCTCNRFLRRDFHANIAVLSFTHPSICIAVDEVGQAHKELMALHSRWIWFRKVRTIWDIFMGNFSIAIWHVGMYERIYGTYWEHGNFRIWFIVGWIDYCSIWQEDWSVLYSFYVLITLFTNN